MVTQIWKLRICIIIFRLKFNLKFSVNFIIHKCAMSILHYSRLENMKNTI